MTPVAGFLKNAGKPKIEFSTCFESSKTYLIASGMSGIDEQRKAYLLRYYLGTEGVRILGTCPDPKETMEEMKITMLTHFQPISTGTLMRSNLWKYQRPLRESRRVRTAIRALGAACDIHQLEDSITRDTFICSLATSG